MQVDRAQFQKIQEALGATTVTPAEAELLVAIAQLSVAADRVEDEDELALFDQIVAHVYGVARLDTTPPSLAPVDDEEQRREHLRSHAAQLAGKPTAKLAYGIAYLLTIADMDVAFDEMETVDTLGEALGLSPEDCDDLASTVSEIITPAE